MEREIASSFPSSLIARCLSEKEKGDFAEEPNLNPKNEVTRHFGRPKRIDYIRSRKLLRDSPPSYHRVKQFYLNIHLPRLWKNPSTLALFTEPEIGNSSCGRDEETVRKTQDWLIMEILSTTRRQRIFS